MGGSAAGTVKVVITNTEMKTAPEDLIQKARHT